MVLPLLPDIVASWPVAMAAQSRGQDGESGKASAHRASGAVGAGLGSQGMDETTYPILMPCPARNRPVPIGVSATRENFKTRHFTPKPRFDCAACGGMHMVEDDKLSLSDKPD